MYTLCVCMYVCVDVCVYVCACVYVYVYMCTLCVCMCVCVCVCVCPGTWCHVFGPQAGSAVLSVSSAQPGGGGQSRLPAQGRVRVHVVLEEVFLRSPPGTHTHGERPQRNRRVKAGTKGFIEHFMRLSLWIQSLTGSALSVDTFKKQLKTLAFV